jgi:sigma-E factor negative regulatory protein RseB
MRLRKRGRDSQGDSWRGLQVKNWLAPVCFTGLSGFGLSAGAQTPAQVQMLESIDPVLMLQKIATAPRTLNYAGTFTHYSQEASTTSRITHVFDKGDEWERLESIDGPRQEIIRRNDEMYCYQPDSKTLRLDRRITGKFFPALIHGAPESVQANYNVKLGQVERIGGHDCRWVILEPKDALRFLQKLCAEISSGLLLRAKTFNEKRQVVEQFTFTQLTIGKQALKEAGGGHIKSRLKQKEEGWRTDDSARREIKTAETGWWVPTPPAGFKMVKEMTRTMSGKTDPVSHLVYSDGVASISVFIEPLSGNPGFSKAVEEGMVSYAMRALPQYQVTALGEVPLVATQALAGGVTRKSATHGF